MAYFNRSRRCFVSHSTNRRYRGLAKTLRENYFPEFEPPPGLGKRVGPKGYAAGKKLDLALQCLVSRKKPNKLPKWSINLASKVLAHLRSAGITKLKSQLVVFNDKNNYATAVDVCGVDARKKQYVLVELKYSSHPSKNIKTSYSVPGRDRTYMRKCGLPNTIQNQHAMQARATARMFCSCFKVPKAKVRAIVIVAPFSGPILEYPVAI